MHLVLLPEVLWVDPLVDLLVVLLVQGNHWVGHLVGL